jgi:hypothetical protein
MHKRAGLLFLSKSTKRVLVLLDGKYWTVPTFSRSSSVLEDSKEILENYSSGRILPVELYTSKDNEFEFGTYVCLVNDEFNPHSLKTLAWASLDCLPANLHPGLKSTLSNNIIQIKIKTIIDLNLDINL